MSVNIQTRGGLASLWTSVNPILLDRELGIETDTGKTKIGDGVLAWNSLPYRFVGPSGVPGASGASGVAGSGVSISGTGYLHVTSSSLDSPISDAIAATTISATGRFHAPIQDFGTEIDDGNSGTAKTIDFSAGDVHKITMTANCTFTFTPPSGPTWVQIRFLAAASSGYVRTWPGSVTWSSSEPVTLDAGETQIVAFWWTGAAYVKGDWTPSTNSPPTGASGVPGASGIPGASGVSGASGHSGSSGSPGASGIPGDVETETSISSSGSPIPVGSGARNRFIVTAQSVTATVQPPSGSPANGNKLMMRFGASGTQSISFDTIYRPIGCTLPSSLVDGKFTYVFAEYNSQTPKWDVLAVAIQT